MCCLEVVLRISSSGVFLVAHNQRLFTRFSFSVCVGQDWRSARPKGLTSRCNGVGLRCNYSFMPMAFRCRAVWVLLCVFICTWQMVWIARCHVIFSVVIYTLGLGCYTTIGLNIGTGRLLSRSDTEIQVSYLINQWFLGIAHNQRLFTLSLRCEHLHSLKDKWLMAGSCIYF